MTNIFENIINEFNNRNCKLLTTLVEFNTIRSYSISNNYKLNYIASCGHIHTVFYNVFKFRGTGIICPTCKNIENGNNIKNKIKNNEISKLQNIKQEFNCIHIITELLDKEFYIIKGFDGCNVDLIFKPKYIIDDMWVGIQVKTTNRHLTYSFHINNTYKNCLLLFYSFEDNKLWLIPENIILTTKVSIGYKKSKYNIYNVDICNIISKMHELYKITTKFVFDVLNTPTNIYQQREQEFIKYRKTKIDYIVFDYDGMEGTVYDFKIGNLKVQDKITTLNNNICCFQLCKNNGTINKKQNQIQYDIGDNDLYWLNCDNKQTFFVIPEKILIDKQLIGNNIIKKFIKIKIQLPFHKNSRWLYPYMFDYNNIDKDRLLNVIGNN
jgi:hypothetical protein